MSQVNKNFSECKRFAINRTPIQSSVKRDLSENIRAKQQVSQQQNSNEKLTSRERIRSIDQQKLDGHFAAYLNDLPTQRNQSPKQQNSNLLYRQLQKTPLQQKYHQQNSNQTSSSKTVRKDGQGSDQKKRYSLDLCQTDRESLHKRIQELSEKQIKIDKIETSNETAQKQTNSSKIEDVSLSYSNTSLQNLAQKQNQDIVKKENPALSGIKQEPSKFSQKRNGIISAYAANTNQGLVRKYNEDRVSIILNIVRPNYKKTENWPRCAFFGIYDGHGGAFCADFLRDHLHQYVISDENFPENPRQALINGFAKAEKEFIERAEQFNPYDKSGSCAIVVLLVGEICYIANVGDSRAILSMNKGERTLDLSRDHKPCDLQEKERIIEAGGRIYQSQQTTKPDSEGITKTIYGPLRTLPGRLSVSRTFGDIEAKLQKYGGKQGVIISDPEIKVFRVQKSHDYIFMGCDGIFDKMSSSEAIKASWDAIRIEQSNNNNSSSNPLNTHSLCAKGVEGVIQEALKRRSTDNLTGLVISFIDFQAHASPQNTSNVSEKINQQQSEKNLNTSKIEQNNANLLSEKPNTSEQTQQLQRMQKFASNNSSQIQTSSKINNKSLTDHQNYRRCSPAKQIQTSDRALTSEGSQNTSQGSNNYPKLREKYESITPSSTNNTQQQQRRLSLQFQFNNQAETTLLKQQIKAFNTKTIYDASPNNILHSFHSPIIAKKDYPQISQFSSAEDENSKLSLVDTDRIDQSKTVLSDRQRIAVNRRVNCIEKKVNELSSEKYLKALFKENNSHSNSNSRNESSIFNYNNSNSSYYNHSNVSAPSYQQTAQPKIQSQIFNQFQGIYSKSKILNHLDIPSIVHKVF
ncbi:serine/threonine phosphatase 2C (macronuclear) [Tetrahymena thermophila SB210]|uniref:protein-serine/threonine phosphatase n=1 Tax=Tetrahymena thermophila (strain SB210) TaxID=312017 RepID=Q23AG9_TETTS|nr:serine/threonine phosphatase 2C [Tetrahymena thermophila SB210]EAR93523.2 serine/threonine phosphatase 2C [Tetrahymena thermophila SB210]|eukprot:XP_001013768.2 serine/threonine phosphatase 2C [Tetrahymena thermophila SB210]